MQVAADRAFDQTKTVLPVEVARGVYLRNAPSLQALKLMHLMIGTAGGRMAEDVRHEIRLSDIRKIDGMKNHDRASLTPLFEELRAVVIREGDPIDDTQRVIVGGLLDHAVLDRKDPISGDTLLSWFFGRMFREMAEKSNHWAILDRQTVFHLSSKYAVLLFQHVASLANLNRISNKTFTVPELRAVLGVPDDKLERFADLNRRAVTPAITEINHLSRLTLTATPNKIGRTVASVTIGWQVKDDPSAAKRELAGSKVGRQARRNGTAEMVAAAFPESGSVRWTPWEALVREHASKPTPDMELVGVKFREFCAGRGLPLTSAGIEKTFVAWVSKFRIG